MNSCLCGSHFHSVGEKYDCLWKVASITFLRSFLLLKNFAKSNLRFCSNLIWFLYLDINGSKGLKNRRGLKNNVAELTSAVFHI